MFPRVSVAFCFMLMVGVATQASSDTAAERPIYKSPLGLAVDPSGKIAYVALQGANALAVVDLEKGRVLSEIPVGRKPYDVAFHHLGVVVVSCEADDTVVMVDVQAGKVQKVFKVGQAPRGISVVGGFIHVVCHDDKQLWVLDAKGASRKEPLPPQPEGNFARASNVELVPNDATSKAYRRIPRPYNLYTAEQTILSNPNLVINPFNTALIMNPQTRFGQKVPPLDARRTAFVPTIDIDYTRTSMDLVAHTRPRWFTPTVSAAEGRVFTNAFSFFMDNTNSAAIVLLDEPDKGYPDPTDVVVKLPKHEPGKSSVGVLGGGMNMANHPLKGARVFISSGGADTIIVLDLDKAAQHALSTQFVPQFNFGPMTGQGGMPPGMGGGFWGGGGGTFGGISGTHINGMQINGMPGMHGGWGGFGGAMPGMNGMPGMQGLPPMSGMQGFQGVQQPMIGLPAIHNGPRMPTGMDAALQQQMRGQGFGQQGFGQPFGGLAPMPLLPPAPPIRNPGSPPPGGPPAANLPASPPTSAQLPPGVMPTQPPPGRPERARDVHAAPIESPQRVHALPALPPTLQGSPGMGMTGVGIPTKVPPMTGMGGPMPMTGMGGMMGGFAGFREDLRASAKYTLARLPTQANPRRMILTPDGKTLIVSNYLADSLTLIDTESLKVLRHIKLGGQQPDRARRGEILFHTAKVTFQQQFTCASCHPNNGSDGLSWDTSPTATGERLNSRALHGVRDTAPFGWRGESETLQNRAKNTMREVHKHKLSDEAAAEIEAYLETLDPLRPLPQNAKDMPALARGKDLFYGKASCNRCHRGSAFTSDTPRAVILDFKGKLTPFDVPSLRGVGRSAPYLHDGRAATLEEIFEKHNPQKQHGRAHELTRPELSDLVVFLKSL